MIGRLRTIYKLSAATGIAKRALRFLPIAPFDVEMTAPKLIARVYASKPDLFDGSKGPRPHPISTAAVALAQALDDDDLDFEFPSSAQNHLFLALGNLLLDASRNSSRYGLHGGDVRMIRVAEGVYLAHEQRTRPVTDAIVGSLGLQESA